MPGELSAFARVGRYRKQFAICGHCGEEALGIGFKQGVSFRMSVEENLQQLAPETVADQPPGITIGEDNGTDVLLRQPYHVAVIANQVAPVMNDWYSIR